LEETEIETHQWVVKQLWVIVGIFHDIQCILEELISQQMNSTCSEKLDDVQGQIVFTGYILDQLIPLIGEV
jgi:hypothetical protein